MVACAQTSPIFLLYLFFHNSTAQAGSNVSAYRVHGSIVCICGSEVKRFALNF